MATKINARLEDYFNKFKEEVEKLYKDIDNIRCEFIKDKVKVKEYNFTFIADEEIKFVVWYSNDGISYSITQGNNKNKQEILKNIVEKVDICFNEEIKTNSHTFSLVPSGLFDELNTDFSENAYRIEKTSQDNIIKIILDNVFCITISYFETRNTLLMQGKTTPLWTNLFFYFSEKLNLSSTEIVKTYIATNSELNQTEITIDSDLIINNLKANLGEELYSNRNILLPPELEMLKTSEQFLSMNINSFDYSFMLNPSFRVIEGLLRRIINNNKLKDASKEPSKNFYQFHTEKNQLDEQYYTGLNNDKIAIEIVNELYSIYNNSRLIYSHSDGINPAIIKEKEKALAIFNEICTLLKKVQENVDKLFKPIKV